MKPFAVLRMRPANAVASQVLVRATGAQTINSTGGSVIVNPPIGAVIGDLMIAVIMRRSAAASDPPFGWTLRSTTNVTGGGFTQYTHVYSKPIANSSDRDNTVTFSQAASGRIAGQMLALYNPAGGTPQYESEANATSTAGTTTTAIPANTSAGAGRLGLAVASYITAEVAPTTTSMSIDNGFTLQSPPTVADNRLALGTKSLSSGQSTSGTTVTSSVSLAVAGTTSHAVIFSP